MKTPNQYPIGAHLEHLLAHEVPLLHVRQGAGHWFQYGHVRAPELGRGGEPSAVVRVADLYGDPFEYRVTIISVLLKMFDDVGDDGEYYVRRFRVGACEFIGDENCTPNPTSIKASRVGEAIVCARLAFAAFHLDAGGDWADKSTRTRIRQDAAWLFGGQPPDDDGSHDALRVARAWYIWKRAGGQGVMRREIALMLGKVDNETSRTWVKNRMKRATDLGYLPPMTSTRVRDLPE